MEKVIKCPKCDGKGKNVDHLYGMFTAGLGYVLPFLIDGELESDPCKKCDAQGYIIVKPKKVY
jgi:DnaJ-class molecular chaperone